MAGKTNLRKLKIVGRRLEKFEFLHRSLTDIISSPRVKQFCIGITGKPHQRRAAYRKWCTEKSITLDGFVSLDWGYSPDEIVILEQWLFQRAKMNKKYANHAEVKYFPSVSRHLDSQHIYVAWWSPRLSVAKMFAEAENSN